MRKAIKSNDSTIHLPHNALITNFIAYLIQHGKQGIMINNIEHNLYYILVTEAEDVHFKSSFLKLLNNFPLNSY